MKTLIPATVYVTNTSDSEDVAGSFTYIKEMSYQEFRDPYDNPYYKQFTIYFSPSLIGQSVPIEGFYIQTQNADVFLPEGVVLTSDGMGYGVYGGQFVCHFENECDAIIVQSENNALYGDCFTVSSSPERCGSASFINARVNLGSQGYCSVYDGQFSMRGGSLSCYRLNAYEDSVVFIEGTRIQTDISANYRVDSSSRTSDVHLKNLVVEGYIHKLDFGSMKLENVTAENFVEIVPPDHQTLRAAFEASHSVFKKEVEFSGAYSANISDCTFHSYVTVENAEAFSMSGINTFHQQRVFLLDAFKGSTAGLWKTGTIVAPQDAYVQLWTLGTCTLAALPSSLSGGYRLGSHLKIYQGDTVTLEQGGYIALDAVMYVYGEFRASFASAAEAIRAIDSDARIDIQSGGKVDLTQCHVNMLQGSGVIYVAKDAALSMKGGCLDLRNCVDVASGGSLALEGVEVNTALELEPGATLSLKDCSLSSYVQVGSSEGVACSGTLTFAGAETFRLENFTGTTADIWKDCQLKVPEGAYVGLSGTLYTSTLSVLPKALAGNYRLLNWTTVYSGHTVVLEDGAHVDVDGEILNVSGTLRAHHDTISRSFRSTAVGGSIRVQSGGLLDVHNVHLDLNGGWLDVNGGGQALVEGGRVKATVSVSENGTLSAVDVAFSGKLSSYGEVQLTGCSVAGAVVNKNIGTLAAESSFFHGDVESGKNLSLSECVLLGTLTITSSAESVSVNQCDLSACTVSIDRSLEGQIDLSGNYWGTTDLDEIVSRISGYDASKVIIGQVLSSAPSIREGIAPELSLGSVQTKKSGTNKSVVTLSWTCDEAATYVVKVDGKQVYKGTNHEASFTLADGTHQYTLTATDAYGNASIQNGSFVTDTVAPTKPTSPSATLANKKVCFSWGAATDASAVSYELAYRVAGSSTYTTSKGLKATTRTLTLADNTYEWRVRAKDAQGNYSAWVNGADIAVDFVAPKVTGMATAQKKTATGKATVTLTWKSNEAASYVVKVGGKQVYAGSSKKASFSLADGYHKYSITATDAAGNASTRTGAFRVDTTAPTKPKAPIVRLQDSGKTAVFSWGAATDVSGVTYDLALKLPGSSSYTHYKDIDGTQTSLTLSKKGTYKWGIRAKDGKGNVTSWVWADSFNSADTTAPKVSYMATTQKKTAVGKATVTLTWKCNETASYVVKVGGKQVYAGSSKKASFSLADGYHKYSITATDTVGNVSTRTGAFRVDTKAPAKAPSSLRVQLTHGGTRVALRWTGSHDISGVTYDVAFKKSTDSAYTHYKNLSDPSLILTLAGTGEYKWGVRARDGKNNVTSWVWGDSFSNSSARTAAPTAAAVASLDQELALSSGMAALSDGGCAAATCDGPCMQGREKSVALLAS